MSGALGAAAFVNTAGAGTARATETRTLGNTGLRCSYLGAGTGIRGSGPGITELTLKLNGEQFVSLLEHAYARGITYFDLADRYGSHHFMRLAMRRSIPRDKVMLLSKVWSREAETVKHDLERMRGELDTDCIDIVLMHCLRQGEENWPETLKPAMDVLADAKARGHIRAHGVSCHILPALEQAADEPWCDAVLARINPFGINMDGPVETIVPILQRIHNAGKAVIGMKVLGEGHEEAVQRMDESFAFVTGLDCVDAVTIGFMNPGELDEVISRMK
ncbi:MAG TPA: aldo/keto reductase [Candidatus Hydrogenedentes bacterium]|nr:aldo/keto reductase [Candidatus Hydrogenedentota bacterium]